jgi:hypothetical protein
MIFKYAHERSLGRVVDQRPETSSDDHRRRVLDSSEVSLANSFVLWHMPLPTSAAIAAIRQTRLIRHVIKRQYIALLISVLVAVGAA